MVLDTAHYFNLTKKFALTSKLHVSNLQFVITKSNMNNRSVRVSHLKLNMNRGQHNVLRRFQILLQRFCNVWRMWYDICFIRRSLKGDIASLIMFLLVIEALKGLWGSIEPKTNEIIAKPNLIRQKRFADLKVEEPTLNEGKAYFI